MKIKAEINKIESNKEKQRKLKLKSGSLRAVKREDPNTILGI